MIRLFENFGIRIIESDAVEPNSALLVSACAQPDSSNCEKNETEFDRLLHAHDVHDAVKITGIRQAESIVAKVKQQLQNVGKDLIAEPCVIDVKKTNDFRLRLGTSDE